MISVCIATYNGERFIREQLDSILPQIGDDDEIIVSDDGSSDATVSVVESIGDKRIRLIKGPGRQSPTLNFENALRAAEGDYIFLADQDDVWKADKVKVCMKWLESHDCVISDAEMADRRLNIMRPSYFKAHGTRTGHLYNLLVKNGYMGCCMAFTRRVKETSLPFPKDIPLHDIWIGNVAAFLFNIVFIPDRLITFRCHDGNTSFTADIKSGNSLSKKIYIRWRTLCCLVSLIIKNKHQSCLARR